MSTDQDSVRRLAEIRERTDKATPGPWLDDEDGRDDILPMLTVWPVSQPDDGCEERGYLLGQPIHIAHAVESRDQEFIAHSREDVPYLLSLIDSLTAERDHKDESYERAMRWLAIAIKDRQAAEADRERLRGALELIAGGESLDAAGCARVARAALATPPSEGEQSDG